MGQLTHMYESCRVVWGGGRDPQKNTKCTLLTQVKKRKFHGRRTQVYVTTLLEHASRITHHEVPLDGRTVTVL